MMKYLISGDGYNKIVVDAKLQNNYVAMKQYYFNGTEIHKTDKTELYLEKTDSGYGVKSIMSDSDDTLIIPKSVITEILPYAVRGCKFRRIVVPTQMALKLDDKSLYGSDTLREFISLSHDVVYGGDVFPKELVRRRV